ncbi:hypothetical protein [Halopenitus persicus]|uniref:hypothetical protein n=1 Tax=Halopenitus persicus TaxID=1048396 RepID=UPI000BBA5C85|nr:hypothetical protein [Halopenitus persicus]
MATETRSADVTVNITSKQWIAGAVGGFIGSIPFGLLMMYVMPPPLLEVVIPAMYGIEGPALLAGWAIHQFHGVVLGLTYVALVQAEPLRETARSTGGAMGLAVAYGIVTTVVLAVIVMPLWLGAVGFPNAPPFPNVGIPATIITGIGHVIYAVPVAVLYARSFAE